ncbi:hypothetical protein CBM2585_A130133 [Cupriavidus taiwanensis]|nr:hypothetical protein CBM2585_A130133 [Cupriavidus taiwanensis]
MISVKLGAHQPRGANLCLQHTRKHPQPFGDGARAALMRDTLNLPQYMSKPCRDPRPCA